MAGQVETERFLFVEQALIVVPVVDFDHVHVAVLFGCFLAAEHVVLPRQRRGVVLLGELHRVVQAGHE